MIGRVASIVSVLVNYKLICGLLSESDVSLYVVSVGATGLGTLFAGAGLSTVLLRRISPRSRRNSSDAADGTVAEGDATKPVDGPLLKVDGPLLARRVTSLVAMMWVVTAVLLVVVLRWKPELLGRSMDTVLVWIIFWIAARSILVLVTEAFRGLQRFSAAAMFGGLQEGPLVNVTVMAGLLLLGTTITTAAEVLRLHVLITMAVAMIGGFRVWQLIRSNHDAVNRDAVNTDAVNTDAVNVDAGPTGTWSRPGHWELMSEGSKVLTSQMAIFGLVEFETLLIGRYCSDVQTGTWGAIRRLIGVVSGPLLLINAMIPSFVAELHASGDLRKLQTLLRTASTLATPPAVLALAVVLVFGRPLLATFDPNFAIGWSALALLAAANIFFVAAGSAGLTLRMTNRQGWATVSTLALSVIYVLSAPWVIERYQLWGAAVMAAIMIVARNVIATLLVKRFLDIWCVPTLNLTDVRHWVIAMRKRRRTKKSTSATAANG